MKISQKILTETIKEKRSELMKEDEDISSIQNINNGWCHLLADKVVYELNWEFLYQTETNDFRIEGYEHEAWNKEFMKKQGIYPPEELTWEDLNFIPFDYHVWIAFEGERHGIKCSKYYDAECPEGVDNFFNLPFFKRYIYVFKTERHLLKQKDISHEYIANLKVE
ncbi:MAG: hypothetical protein ACOCQR_02545 [bacterium]